jgi:Xaa-Pro aminopeptidase
VIDLERTQAALREHGLGAWVLYDFRGSNPVLWHVLGAEPPGTTRRLMLVLPANGEPVLITSRLDRDLVAGLGVPLAVYRRWQELVAELEGRLRGAGRVAMEYSPGGALPIVSWVDAGTVELVRSLGVEVVSSGDVFGAVAAAWDAAAEASHQAAVRHVIEVRDIVLTRVREELGRIREREAADLIEAEFARRGLEIEGSPCVAVGPNSGNPHYEPRTGADAVIGPDQVLLVDLWARVPGERHVFGDVTWMSFTGPEAPAPVLAAFDAVAAGRDAALALLHDAWSAGRVLRGFELDRAAREAIEAAGHGDGILHRTGHSLGPGPRVHGLGPNLDDFETRDERTLAPGMGFTVEPGVYGPEFGVRLECDVHLHPSRGPVVTTPLQTRLTFLH